MFSPKVIYLLLAAAGAVIPYIPFLRWLTDQSLDWQLPGRFVSELFSTRIGAFFGLDVVLSAIALFVFMAYERRSLPGARIWPATAATLCVGVSCGLPLYLHERERRREAAA